MTQNAVVTKVYENGKAEVAVVRTTACGGNCGNCESCIFQNELKTVARNLIGAKPGQRVVIESQSSKVYGAIILVYIVPIILALAGYFTAYAAGAAEGICVLATFIGILIGAVVLVLSQKMSRNKKPITFDIIQIS